ncbi:CAP domain-containing protein [Nonomuraea angiospora]|uniref:CAP domain-containing protein n=1 Tax=Nonomuraea angiospora TaxID=46172 RepID=UPI003439E89A
MSTAQAVTASPASDVGQSGSLSLSGPATAAALSGAAGVGTARENTVVRLVNARRAKKGCRALKHHPQLHRAAREHSADMAECNYFSNTSRDGRSFTDRIKEAGFTGGTSLAENIAKGPRTPAAVVQSWMSSSGTKATILNCRFHLYWGRCGRGLQRRDLLDPGLRRQVTRFVASRWKKIAGNPVLPAARPSADRTRARLLGPFRCRAAVAEPTLSCPVEITLAALRGRWTTLVVRELLKGEHSKFTELGRVLPTLSDKVGSATPHLLPPDPARPPPWSGRPGAVGLGCRGGHSARRRLAGFALPAQHPACRASAHARWRVPATVGSSRISGVNMTPVIFAVSTSASAAPRGSPLSESSPALPEFGEMPAEPNEISEPVGVRTAS